MPGRAFAIVAQRGQVGRTGGLTQTGERAAGAVVEVGKAVAQPGGIAAAGGCRGLVVVIVALTELVGGKAGKGEAAAAGTDLQGFVGQTPAIVVLHLLGDQQSSREKERQHKAVDHQVKRAFANPRRAMC